MVTVLDLYIPLKSVQYSLHSDEASLLPASARISVVRGGRLVAAAAAVAAPALSIPERYKVVALTACVMCLCNADRVVMSVAVVPLAANTAGPVPSWASSR